MKTYLILLACIIMTIIAIVIIPLITIMAVDIIKEIISEWKERWGR